jgi:hypothetical protein
MLYAVRDEDVRAVEGREFTHYPHSMLPSYIVRFDTEFDQESCMSERSMKDVYADKSLSRTQPHDGRQSGTGVGA